MQGYRLIAGVDEVGRGPLCGPVVACAVIFPNSFFPFFQSVVETPDKAEQSKIENGAIEKCRDARFCVSTKSEIKNDNLSTQIKDSKKLTEKKREELFPLIKEQCICYGIGVVGHEDIDKYNIRQATFMAMNMALAGLKIKPDYVLVDGHAIPDLSFKQKGIIKGDSLSTSIAAASILAKVTRDRMMIEYDKKYPQYNFKKNKGYGTKDHIEALLKFGATEIHRKTFAPVRK